jgi:hypothetical protein
VEVDHGSSSGRTPVQDWTVSLYSQEGSLIPILVCLKVIIRSQEVSDEPIESPIDLTR